ncbi:alkaline phosphatase D family protein [Corynebacterium sp. A21]|uniref:alkaline phosphatase D family protein n=1 Tax=Corynebacterium sp. A21 TaxID=3457318 RepID=UPI003FCF3AC1
MPLSRRTLLKTGVLAAGAGLALPRDHLPFQHGVASGDPLPDSVILWTRLTPSPEAIPGSGQGALTPVSWEVARDEGFRDVVTRGRVTSGPARDHTLHVDPGGLEPDTVYYFRFLLDDGRASPTGRTQTAPPFDSNPDSLTLAVASCANWESGYFSAYSDIAARAWAGQLDLCVFLGDYLYEYGRGEYTAAQGALRLHEPPHELLTLADYRIRHGHYRTDRELQAAHAALPWSLTWDDHEIANNSWRAGAKNHSPGEGEWQGRRHAAMQAYLEWLPVRASGTPIYRTLRFGNLAELSMLDLRSYRDQASFTDPQRTMMGQEQFHWLQRRVETANTRWNLLGNSVMLAPMELGRVDPRVQEALGSPFNGIPLNADQWDGFAADRARLLQVLADKGTPTLFLTGDIHTEWANRVMFRGEELGVELVCSSVSAPNVDEQLKLSADNPASHLAEQLIRDSNPHVRHVDLDSHGYSIAHLTAAEVQLTWLRVDDVERRGSPVREAIGLTWRPDRGFTS